MDRITHQLPRQQGYGSTSSLRNDSLKHTWKHERRREESNQDTKLPGSGGPSGQAGRTVRKGRADCPAGYRGLSSPLPRTVWPELRTVREKGNRTSRDAPWITDHPRGARGLSARHPRTVRPEHVDRPKPAQPKLKTTTDRKQRRARTRRTRDEHAQRGQFCDEWMDVAVGGGRGNK
jgi:hypothetical protein